MGLVPHVSHSSSWIVFFLHLDKKQKQQLGETTHTHSFTSTISMFDHTHTHTGSHTLLSFHAHIHTFVIFTFFIFAHMYTHLHTFLFCFFSPSISHTYSQQFSLCPLSLSSSDTLFGRLLSDAGMSQREEGRGCVGDVSVTSTPLCLMRDTRQC